MRRWLRYLAWALLAAFLVIQFFQPERNIHEGPAAASITKQMVVPANVLSMLKSSCFDCHSNNTAYPWYFKIQPAAWFMAGHIEDGKAALNFDEFGNYSRRRQINKLKSIAHEVEDGEMPLWSYTLIHSHARLSSDRRKIIIDWANQRRDELDTLRTF